jgi:ribosome-binding factor A
MKVAKELRSILSKILPSVMKWNECGLKNFSITRITMSPDLRHASVFINVDNPNDEKDIILNLKNIRVNIQQKLGKMLSLRFLLILRFAIDKNFQYESEIERILRENVLKDE